MLIPCQRGDEPPPSPSEKKSIDVNNKQSVAGSYGNYVESERANRIRLLHRPSADHMRYTLHTVCGRLPERVHRASQGIHTIVYL